MVLYPGNEHVSHSMKKIMRDKIFRFTFDIDFEAVIHQCKRQFRHGRAGTWITQSMLEAYIRLHEKGYAHSMEVWRGNHLAGGLYGVSLGSFFSGESMFSTVSNASKAGFITLAKVLKHLRFHFIDCQMHTLHLASLGACEISRKQYSKELATCLLSRTIKGNWSKHDTVRQALETVSLMTYA